MFIAKAGGYIVMDRRKLLKNKKRIVIKVGTSTITHKKTGNIDIVKLEKFVEILVHLKHQGKEVIVVSSGAIGVGRKVLGIPYRPTTESLRQACAAVGQGQLIMVYEKLFHAYGQVAAQILLTKESVTNEGCKQYAKQAFCELLRLQVVPIVNENDAIAMTESGYGNFGDNDTMAAYVAQLVKADLLILISDIEGLYTDDPRSNQSAKFVHTVSVINAELEQMGKGTESLFGTGGMANKIKAAKVVTQAGADMVIANGENMQVILDIINGKMIGTLFVANQRKAC